MLEKHLAAQNFDIEETRPAGFWIRVAASLIDMLILAVFSVGALFMKSVGAYLLMVLPTILYKPVLEGLLGGTAGKLAIGLRVINAHGQLLGLAGGFVRAGVFILPAIPNILLQVKMIQQGISPFDPEQAMAFQQANELLYYVSYALSALLLVSCLVVAFTRRKRGLHDFIADSYVIHHDKGTAPNEG
ncbi:MAG: RDD family protein [Oceanipulchritudo sp.]